MASGWNLWVWLQCICVVSGCCCKEIYIYIYIGFLIILLIPTPLALVLFCSRIPTSFLFLKCFFILVCVIFVQYSKCCSKNI